MSEASYSILQQFLNPGEKITWRGLPHQGFLRYRSAVDKAGKAASSGALLKA